MVRVRSVRPDNLFLLAFLNLIMSGEVYKLKFSRYAIFSMLLGSGIFFNNFYLTILHTSLALSGLGTKTIYQNNVYSYI
jgi:hypothetical protein